MVFKRQDRKFVEERGRRERVGVGIIPLLLDLANTSSVFPPTFRAQTHHGLLSEDVDFVNSSVVSCASNVNTVFYIKKDLKCRC